MTKHKELSEHEQLLLKARDLADPNFSLSVPNAYKDVIRRLLEALPTPPVAGERRGHCSVCSGPVFLDQWKQWGHTERDDYGHRVVLAEKVAPAAGEPEREALIATVQSEMRCERRAHYGNVEQPYCGTHGGYGVWPCRESEAIADAILAAGYRRQPEPREVTTVEELDALQVGTVILDLGKNRIHADSPVICCKTARGDWDNSGDRHPDRRWTSVEIERDSRGNVLIVAHTPSTERGES